MSSVEHLVENGLSLLEEDISFIDGRILNENEENIELDEEFCSTSEYNFIEELEIQEKYDRVVKIIEKLDEKYSTTLYLVFCKEMTVKEIADMMGISTKTVYTRLARGKKLLLDSLKGAKIDE